VNNESATDVNWLRRATVDCVVWAYR
jgi:hypothetical protein